MARIAALSGASIATSDPSLLAGTGPAIRVSGTAAQALAALLRGTRATAVPIGANGWRIVARNRRVKRQPPSPLAPPAAPIADVVVTGSKRSLRLADYPAAVAIVDGARVGRFGIAPDSDALTRIEPSLQSTHLGPGRNKLFLRGISDSSFNGSGAALVGLYLGDLRLTYNAPDPDLRLYDVARVEILQGPQGTLYGAGAMAGLVRIVPNAPVPGTASGEAWAGGTATAHGAPGGDIGGMLNLPIAGDAALRIVGYAASDGGYIDDTLRRRSDVNRTATVGGRAMLRVGLGGAWTLDLGGIVQEIRNRDAQYGERDEPVLTRSAIAAQPSANLFHAGEIVVSGQVGALDLTSTTGIIRQSLAQSFLPDDGNAPTIYRQDDAISLLTEEVRLASPRGSALSWVAGLSAVHSRTRQTRISSLDGQDRSLGEANEGVTDLTAFGEATLPLAPTLSLTAGARVATVRLEGRAVGALAKELPDDTPAFVGVRHERFAVPSLALGWTPRPGWLAFARYGQGYRPGGQTASGVIQRYDADRIRSWEAGVRRIGSNDRRLSGQVSAAVSRWSDIQADVLSANGLPVTANIGDGWVRTISGTLAWRPWRSLQLGVAGMLAGGYVTGHDVTADAIIRSTLTNVASYKLAATVDWRQNLAGDRRLTVKLSANHVGKSVLGSGSELSRITQGNYWLLASGASLEHGRQTISVDVDNLLDSAANSFAFGIPTFRFDDRERTPLRPRTIRIGLRRSF